MKIEILNPIYIKNLKILKIHNISFFRPSFYVYDVFLYIEEWISNFSTAVK